MDTGFYPERRYTAAGTACSCCGPTAPACGVGAGCANACAASPDVTAAPFSDNGPNEIVTLDDGDVQQISIIGSPIPRGTILFGRDPDNNIYINNVYVGPGSQQVRFYNLEFRDGRHGLGLDGSQQNIIESCISNAHPGLGGGGGTPGAGVFLFNNAQQTRIRNVQVAENAKAGAQPGVGIEIRATQEVWVENSSFYRNQSAELRILSDGGVDSQTIRVRNNIFHIANPGTGISVATNNDTGFSSNNNYFAYDAGGGSANTGSWLGANQASLINWQTATQSNGDACTGPAGGSCDADSCDCASASEGVPAANIEPVWNDAPNRDYHLRARFGRFDPASEIFLLGDDIGVTNPWFDTGAVPPSYAAFLTLELESDAGTLNLGGYGNTHQASRTGTNVGLSYVAGSLCVDPDGAGALANDCANPRSFNSGERPIFTIDVTNAGTTANANEIVLGDMEPGDTCALAGAGPSYAVLTDGTNTHRAYLTGIAGATGWCIEPGQTATLTFTSYSTVPADMCSAIATGAGSDGYFLTAVLRGFHRIKNHFDDNDGELSTLLGSFIAGAPRQMGNNSFHDGLAPMVDQVIETDVGATGGEDDVVSLRGRACASASFATTVRYAYVSGSLTPLTIDAGTGADSFTANIRRFGAATSIGGFDAGCDAAPLVDPTDSYVELTDVNGNRFRTCYAGVGTAVAADSAGTAITFNSNDLGAATLCNGPASVTFVISDGAAQQTLSVPDLVYVVDGSQTNCTYTRSWYVQGTRAPASLAAAANIDITLSIRNIGTDGATLDENPVGSITNIFLYDGEQQSSATSYCKEAGGDCDGGGSNPFSMGEIFTTVRMDDTLVNGADDAAPTVAATLCRGVSELRLNVRGTESTADGATAVNDTLTVQDSLTIGAGSTCCLSYVVGTLAQTAAVADDVLADGVIALDQGEAGVVLQVQVHNLSDAAVGPWAANSDFQFRICDDAACVGDFTANCSTINGGACTATAIGAGEVATIVFAATAVPAGLTAATYDAACDSAGNWACLYFPVGGGAPDCRQDTVAPDRIIINTAAAGGIGRNVPNSGWIEVER